MTKHSDSTHQEQDPAEPATQPTPQEKQRTPLWQALLLPVVAILIFFLLLEGGLALFGVKPDLKTEDPFVGFASNAPLFVPARNAAGQNVMKTSPNKLSLFNEQSFPENKAPNSYRIFTLGGSTTYGRPYNDVTSFSGWLREFLPSIDSSKNWEVINAGGVSYASYRVAHLMEELVNYQPDLFIVYTGQNEFLEERTYGKIKEIPSFVRTTVSLLNKTRTWTAMTGALEKVGLYPEEQKVDKSTLAVNVDAILDQSAGLNRYTRDDALKDNILKHYRLSLERMVALADSVGADILFVTPASNLKDCTPFKSEHTTGLDALTRNRSAKLLADAKQALRQEDYTSALALLDQAISIDPRHAELNYRRGQALLGLQRYEQADAAFLLAADEDVCPLRALSRMRQIVVDVANEQGASYIDYVQLLEDQMLQRKKLRSPGDELFLDHVHPTIEGHKILALALLENMITAGAVEAEVKLDEQFVAKIEQRVNSKIDREVHGQALANLARVLLWAGKLEDAERLARQAQEKAGDFRQVFVDSSSVMTSVYLSTEQYQQAVDIMYATLERAPGAIEIRLKLGQTLLNQRFLRLEESAANLLIVCQQMPTFDPAFADFGLAMAKRGAVGPAYNSLMEALRLNPQNAGAQRTLAQVRPMFGNQIPNPQKTQIMMQLYPSRAPYKLVQLAPGSDGRLAPNGIEVEFFENGRLKRFADFTNGKLNGLLMTWDEQGDILSREAYRQGVLVENALN